MKSAKKVCLAAAVAVAGAGTLPVFGASVKNLDKWADKANLPPGQEKKLPPTTPLPDVGGSTTPTGDTSTGGTTAAPTTDGGGGGSKPTDDEHGTPQPDVIFDLTTKDSRARRNGAWFLQADPQPTGTGVIQPFVRIQEQGNGDGTESGYNTGYRPIDGSTTDTKDQNKWNHPLQTLQTVNYEGVDYVQFLLDVNETGNDANRIIWLDKLEIYLADDPDLTYPDPLKTKGTLIYSLDKPAPNADPDPAAPAKNDDASVKLDYKLNHGSGSGDMYLLVDASLFRPDKYVYLFSEFSGAEAGFEEWASRTAPLVAVPLPAGAAGGLALFAALGAARAFGKLRRRDED